MFEFCNSFAMGSSVLCTIIEGLLHWVAQSGVLSWLLVAVFMHLGCLGGTFGVFGGMRGTLWEVLVPSLVLRKKKLRKLYAILPPKESLGSHWRALWGVWGALLRPWSPKREPRESL